MNTELFIENNRVDISADISSLLTFAIDDVKDFATRQTAFSKTIVLPGTANNNALFGNIFETGHSNSYDPAINNIGYNFNAAKSARCIIFQDYLQTFKGTVRLLEIIKDSGNIEYEITLNGELTGLNVALSNSYLTDLDFSEYDETYSVANIENSWDESTVLAAINGVFAAVDKSFTFARSSVPTTFPFEIGMIVVVASGANAGTLTVATITDAATSVITFVETIVNESINVVFTIPRLGKGLFWPLIDYGTFSDASKHNWKYGTFRPALYVKEYLDKMFAAANFRYTSALFNTNRFKRLVVPQNRKQLVKKSLNDLDVQIVPPLTYTSNSLIPFATQTTLGNFTVNGANTEFTYTPATTLNGTAYFKFSGTYTKPATSGGFDITIERNGSPLTLGSLYIVGLLSTGGTFDATIQTTASILQNDVIRVNVFFNGTSGSITFDTAHLYFSQGAITYVPINLGETVTINDSIPQNIRQVDFLLSIVHLFNLYVYEDQFDERLIKIAPYVDFFSTDSSNAVNWTYKLNRDKPVKIRPMSEINSKIYKFEYKSDNDFFNEEYKKRYNERYGSYIFNSDFEFATQTNNLELIFAGTPLVGYSGEDKVYSTILKKSGNTEESIDSVIRILQTKKVTGVTSWDILDTDGVTVLDSYTKYGYAGHLDDPDNPTNDLNFGALKELFFTLVTGNLTVTQFNVYWSPYMAEITDKDSKLLSGYFYLTPKDIFELDFSKYIYLDSVLFRLNKISDYNATSPNDCEVQLLRVINTLY